MKNLIVFIKSSYSTIWPQSVQHDSANKMRINETYPTTNISNINNYQSVGVTRKSPPFVIKLKTFLTNKEAWKPCFVAKHFGSGVVCILTRHTDSSNYGTTHKNTQRYYTPKRLIKYIYLQLVLHPLQPNNSF